MNILPNRRATVALAAGTVKLRGMTPTQCKAARVLLSWDQPHLAEAAGVSLSTVVDFERTRRTVSPEKIQDIRLALENGGIMFLNEDGVTLRRDKRK